MSSFLSGMIPGIGDAEFSEERNVVWSGRQSQTLVATRAVMLDSTCVDSGNTPTTTLRAGNLIALDDATGRGFIYDPDAADGKQVVLGVLEKTVDMLQNGVATARLVEVIVAGRVKQGMLIALDPRARVALAGRIEFDQEWTNSGGHLLLPRSVYRKAANYTLTAADHGAHFVATAAVSFTLPTKQNGLSFRFTQIADANLAIVGSSDLVVVNNAAASSVTCQTSSEKIGSQLLVECVYTAASTLKWIVTNLGGTTLTIA
jgi:hypothetical protein